MCLSRSLHQPRNKRKGVLLLLSRGTVSIPCYKQLLLQGCMKRTRKNHDCPAFQRRHTSALFDAESVMRLPEAMNTTCYESF